MRKLLVFIGLSLSILSCTAQYGNYNYRNDNDVSNRYFYDEEFDWRWDVRVRISQGINNGFLTRREANRLYDRLEQIERKEFAFQSDGYLSGYEQNEIWDDVVFLNRQLGLELRDFDRTYYGYSLPGVAFRGYMPWYFGNRYDFNRFDRRGFGSIQLGYRPRNFYPRNNFYYHNNRSYSNNRNWNNNRNSNSNRNWDNNRNSNSNRNWDNNRGNDRENSRNSDWNRGSNGNSRGNDNSNRNNRADGDKANQNGNDRFGKNNNDIGSRDERYGDRNSSRNDWNKESSKERSNENAKKDRNVESSNQKRTQNGRANSGSREEILTQRSATPRERSENKKERSALPERKKANDSNRRGEN